MDPELARHVSIIVASSPFVLQSSSDDAEDVSVCHHITRSAADALEFYLTDYFLWSPGYVVSHEGENFWGYLERDILRPNTPSYLLNFVIGYK